MIDISKLLTFGVPGVPRTVTSATEPPMIRTMAT